MTSYCSVDMPIEKSEISLDEFREKRELKAFQKENFNYSFNRNAYAKDNPDGELSIKPIKASENGSNAQNKAFQAEDKLK